MDEIKVRQIGNADIGNLRYDEILFVGLGESGAMGEPGALNIILAVKGKVKIYHANFRLGDFDMDRFSEVFTPLKTFDCGSFGEVSGIADGWHHVYMGMGNHLFVRDAVFPAFSADINGKTDQEIYCCYMDKAIKAIVQMKGMQDKVSKHSLPYPKGYKPDWIEPVDYCGHRFAIGKKGYNPLVAICMNPSAANDTLSDSTINRIIRVSKDLNMDGWVVFNLYPERATNAKNIGEYNEELSKKNIEIIRDFLIKNSITEVWGAWGNGNHKSLRKGKKALLDMLCSINVKVFYYGTLTKSHNPRHPLQRGEKEDFSDKNRHYLSLKNNPTNPSLSKRQQSHSALSTMK